MADTKLMMDAISAEDLAQVSKLLQGSLHVDTPLHPRTKACALHLAVGHPQVLTALLDEHGASIDKSSFDGSTALIYAAMNGCSESVRILCERGANVNAADDDGDGPLYYAEDNGRGYASYDFRSMLKQETGFSFFTGCDVTRLRDCRAMKR